MNGPITFLMSSLLHLPGFRVTPWAVAFFWPQLRPGQVAGGPCPSFCSERATACFECILEGFLHGIESLNEFKLLAIWAFAIDQGPAVRLPLGNLVGVGVNRSVLALLF